MALTRRGMISAGGLAAGVATAQALMGPSSVASAAMTASKDALSVKDTTGGLPAATGGGSIDDTLAVQGHIDYVSNHGGGAVFFPVGTYKVSQTITVKPGVNIVCGGNAMLGPTSDASGGSPGTATLLGAQNFTGTLLQTEDRSGNDPRGSIISNLRVAGQTPAAANTPSVLFRGGSYGFGTRVEGCAFWRPGGEVVRWSAIGIFTNNLIWGHPVNGCVGLRVTTPDCKIFGNEITSNSHCVIVDGSAGGVLFEHNACYNSNTGAGIWFFGLRSIISGNRSDENATAGILVEGWGNVISGNQLVLNGVDATKPAPERAGIRIQFGWGNAVTGNTCSNWDHSPTNNTQQYGISLTGNTDTRNNTITGNAFTTHPLGPIYTGPGIGTGNIFSANSVEP